MKKTLILIASAMIPFASMAKDLVVVTNNEVETSTESILPQQGDWAVGINVIPLFRYVGNAFNGNTDNDIEYLGGEPFIKTEDWNNRGLMPDVSIQGKYMLTDEFGLRANIGLMVKSRHDKRYVDDDKALVTDPMSENKLIDEAVNRRNGMSIMLGGEYRKGKRRVQGVFGAGLLFAFQNDKTTYSYGNQISSVNQQPSSAFAGVYNDGYRTITDNGMASDYFAGITTSVGVEWFIAPKISIGAEVNLSAYFIMHGQQYREYEGYNTATGNIDSRIDIVSPKTNEFYLGTESLGGSLNMTFYF